MKYEELLEMIEQSNNIVFFGGAGVSTESGIPDFRGEGGLYTEADSAEPEYMLSNACLAIEPKRFFDYYRTNMLSPKAMPNSAHYALARLEAQGKLKAVITQNIDGLHQKAGSKTVYELHGTTRRHYCLRCGKEYGDKLPEEAVPRCDCGGVVRPDVVLYGEGLNSETLNNAIEAVAEADMLIVGGTSLTVHPAAGIVMDYVGERLVIINKTPTAMDGYADLVIRDPIGEVFRELEDYL